MKYVLVLDVGLFHNERTVFKLSGTFQNKNSRSLEIIVHSEYVMVTKWDGLCHEMVWSSLSLIVLFMVLR